MNNKVAHPGTLKISGTLYSGLKIRQCRNKGQVQKTVLQDFHVLVYHVRRNIVPRFSNIFPKMFS